MELIKRVKKKKLNGQILDTTKCRGIVSSWNSISCVYAYNSHCVGLKSTDIILKSFTFKRYMQCVQIIVEVIKI